MNLVRYEEAVSVEALDKVITSSIFWAEVNVIGSWAVVCGRFNKFSVGG